MEYLTFSPTFLSPLSSSFHRNLLQPLLAQQALLSRLLAAQLLHPEGGQP